MRYYALRLDSPPQVMATGTLCPEFDLNGKRVQDLREPVPLQQVAFQSQACGREGVPPELL